jgi:hypothetical protein
VYVVVLIGHCRRLDVNDLVVAIVIAAVVVDVFMRLFLFIIIILPLLLDFFFFFILLVASVVRDHKNKSSWCLYVLLYCVTVCLHSYPFLSLSLVLQHLL